MVLLNEEQKRYIEQVNALMQRYIPNTLPQVYEPIREYVFRGGKRIRPLFMYTYYKALGGEGKEEMLITIGALLELFHNFTLIHDDIEDNSDFRRGKPTLHRALNIPVAINMGDALYTIVWQRLVEDVEEREVLKVLGRAFRMVVEGQGIELDWYLKGKVDVSEEEYFKMVEGKTGALFGAACEIATLLSGNGKREEAFEFGKRVGIAFQIQDDLLNIVGDFDKYKKEIGGDISEGKRTLMVIESLRNLGEEERAELINILKMQTKDKGIVERGIELIKKGQGPAYAAQVRDKVVKHVMEHIANLPNKRWAEDVRTLVTFIVKREA